jgi:hypothetical protein
VTPLLVSALVTVLGASTPRWCQPPFTAELRQRVAAPSLAGLPGLFEVPAAVSAVDKSTVLAFNDIHTDSVPGATIQRNAFIGFGFLPRLTLVGRGSWITANNQGIREIAASAQLLLANEGTWTPSVAIGAQDIGGQISNYKTRYVTASKTLAGRVRLTGGVGQPGTFSLSGLFGGVEVSPCTWVTAIAENDGVRRNYGLRLAPLGEWGDAHGIQPTFDALWSQRQGRILSVGLRFTPPRPRPRIDSGSSLARRPPSHAVSAPPTATTLSDALVAYGIENVRISRRGDTVAVAYENRVFNQEEWDALGVVFAEVARHAEGARTMRATILRVGLPVMQVVSDIDAFRGLMTGALGTAAFARQLTVTYPRQVPVRGPAANASSFRLDVTVRPRFEPLLLTEIGAAESRTSLLPEAILQLGRGLSLTARRAIVVHQTSLFPPELEDPNADQFLLHAAGTGLPFGLSLPGVVSQVSVGRFGHYNVGGSIESDMVLGDGRWSVGGVAAVLGDHPTRFTRSVALGSVRYRVAPLDLETTVTAGRYLHGDVGATTEVKRRFGLMEVGFFVEATEVATMVGGHLAIPLMFARDPRPGPARIRMPGYYDYYKRTQILRQSNVVRTDVAVPLDTGMGLERVFRDRDRLNALVLGERIVRLRDAALKWVGP